MRLIVFALIASCYLLGVIPSASAEECTSIYGGGPVCTMLNPRPTNIPTPIPQSSQTTTKGGMTVFPASQTTENPATGPELIPLFALLPSGLLGALLRKKSVG